MRLYHPSIFRQFLILSLIFLGSVWGCVPPQATQSMIKVEITADNQINSLTLPAGSTVQQALNQANLTLNALDRTEPPLYTILSDGSKIQVIRVTEQFEVEQVVIPYELQTLYNESLTQDDKEILIQKGKNGLQEVTYRRVFENGVETTSQPVPIKIVVIEEPIPQIRMVGVQAPLASVSIPGRLVYLRDGNVWMIEGTTGNRRAVVTTGDLDGRIFSLSSDGSWLLFTRRSNQEGQINSLWATKLTTDVANPAGEISSELVNLSISNVIHFADWFPGSNTKVIFSTVEPRQTAPGWQANNDLNVVTFSTTGWTTKWTVILEANAGGVYGWWGTQFAWAPGAQHLAFARADSVGLINYEDGSITTLMDIVPLLTRRDWAWVPSLSWGPDGNVLYTINHVAPAGSLAPEESPYFDVTAIPLQGGSPVSLVSQSGMFSYPLASPLQVLANGETNYQIAYLQAIFNSQSETSRYRLAIMDRDGSNQKVLFPSEGAYGMLPQQNWGAWSPIPMPESGNYALAVLHGGNLWLVDAVSGQAIQVTSDGLTTRVDWR